MVYLQDVVKLHTFVLGHLGALLLACFGFDLRFALVAFDLVSDSIWCEGVGVGVGARGGSTWDGGDYVRGALGWERRANFRATNKARSHTHTQAQATQPLHRGPPTPIPTALQHSGHWPRLGSSRTGASSPPRCPPYRIAAADTPPAAEFVAAAAPQRSAGGCRATGVASVPSHLLTAGHVYSCTTPESVGTARSVA